MKYRILNYGNRFKSDEVISLLYMQFIQITLFESKFRFWEINHAKLMKRKYFI